jgi:hypothetical protein
LRRKTSKLKSTPNMPLAGFWPEPTLQINPRFKTEGNVRQDWELRKHQAEAIVLDHDKKSFVVTTGTGSGKSLCYFIPTLPSPACSGDSSSAGAVMANPSVSSER